MRKGTRLVELLYRSGEYAQIARRRGVGTLGRYMRNGVYFQGVWLTEDERSAVCALAVESKQGNMSPADLEHIAVNMFGCPPNDDSHDSA